MKKIAIVMIVILLLLSSPFVAFVPYVTYAMIASGDNTSTKFTNLDLYVFQDLTIFPDGTGDLNISIGIPSSPLAEIYRESLIKTNEDEFLSALSKEWSCSLGLSTRIVQLKIAPYDGYGEFRIYVYARVIPRSLSIFQGENVDVWTLDVGPMNSTIFTKCLLTKLVFIQLLLDKLPGEQVYRSFSSTQINLPSGAALLNRDEIDRQNWFIDLGGGTSVEATLSFGETIILNETTIVTEQEITKEPAEVCNTLQGYKLFTIKYSLPHSEGINLVRADDKVSENFAWEWGPIPLVDKTFEASWIYEDDIVSAEANVTAHVKLDVSGYVGWVPTFPNWWNKLQRFEAWTKAEVRVDLTVNVSVSAQVEKTFDFINFNPIHHPLVLWIGWFPVEVSVCYNVSAGLDINIEGQINAVVKSRANAWLKAGVAWNNTHGWHMIWESNMGIDQIDSTIEFNVKASIKPNLTNRLDVKFYETVGPYIKVVLYALAEIENQALKSVKIGLEVFAGIDFADPLKKLLGLREWEWPLWETVLKEWIFAEVHDVAISFIQVSKTKIYPGDSVNIMVDVANLGQYDENVVISLSYVDKNGLETQIETRELQLPSGTGLCPLFTWDTTGISAGTYIIEAEASIDHDDDLTNNIFMTIIEIMSIDFYVTLDYTETKAWYKPGELTQTRVQVKNLRNVNTTAWLGVSVYDPTGEHERYQQQISITPASATIEPGQVANFTVTWMAPLDAPIGPYKMSLNCYKDSAFIEKYSDNIDYADAFYVYKLKILLPTITTPAITRDINNPSPILISVTWIPKAWLDPFSDEQPTFSVKIGNKPATVQLFDIPFSHLGIYTLWVAPPTQDNEGLFNVSVTVSFDQLEDSAIEHDAVKYVAALPTEPIEKGLAWLRTQQKPDGSWQSNLGVTSLAVLAFLNAGYDETDVTVSKAISYILSNVKSDGSIYKSYPTYETSLAILPLVATRNEAYKTIIENAKKWLVNSQWDESCLWGGVIKDSWYYGGWGYGGGQRPDLSNTQFALLALDAAGLPKDDPTWVKAQVFLHRCQNINFPITLNIDDVEYTVQPYNHYGGYDGGFIYYPGTSLAGGQTSYGSMTGAGIWGLLLSGVPKTDPRIVAAMNWVKNHYTWDTNPGIGWWRMYYYYLSMSKALTMYGQSTIDGHDWYQELYNKIVGMQIAAGSGKGYWSTSNEDYVPDLTTAYAILSLQTRAIAPPVQRLSYLIFILRSNCLIRIIDPDGNLVGYNYITGFGENQIPTAVYSGPLFEPQYIVIINPKAGTYRLELIGISEGPYELTIQGNYGEEITDIFEYSGYIRPGELHSTDVTVTAIVGPIDVYANPPESAGALDSIPPTTTIEIGEPKYIDDEGNVFITAETPIILRAEDDPNGTGVAETYYRIYNVTYDTGWQTYTAPFYLLGLADGTYTIEYYSVDNAQNMEDPHAINVTLFSWCNIFEDTYGRGTILKINLAHKFFQFITPDKDYGIRKATYMQRFGNIIVIKHYDGELRLNTIAVDTRLDFCLAIAFDLQVRKQYFLIDKPGME
jgi:squalene-hopene/tetraprenyl-beta-curcumene cyclase